MVHRISMVRPIFRQLMAVFSLLLLFVTGCSPKLSPLYRDYRIDTEAELTDDVETRIEIALANAGWTVMEGVTPNTVTTEQRTFRQWGLYSVEVELEVTPVGSEYVRVFINPFRHYFTGSRRKIPYLRGGLAKSVLKSLHESFAEEGLVFIGTAQSRDKAALQRGG